MYHKVNSGWCRPTAHAALTPATSVQSPNTVSGHGSSHSWYLNIECWHALALVGLGATIGVFGWSGAMPLSCLPLLMPFVYVTLPTRKLAALFVLAYYAGATWPIIPGAGTFFGDHVPPFLPEILWLIATTLPCLPWIVLFSKRFRALSAIVALILLALPPLSLVTLAHPLTVAGTWFPGFRWFGLAFPLLFLFFIPYLGFFRCIGILTIVALLAHIPHSAPAMQLKVIPVNTQFGGSAFDPRDPLILRKQSLSIQNEALAHPGAVLLFPETIIPSWSPATDAFWSDTLQKLEEQNTSILVGTTIPIPNTHATYNMLIARGSGQHLAYMQRIPVPIAMWHPGKRTDGFPLQLSAPSAILVRGHRAAVLLCFEQLLMWPALQSLSHNPEMILAPANDYWAAGTRIPQIQHQCVRNWSKLWRIPVYEATNQ